MTCLFYYSPVTSVRAAHNDRALAQLGNRLTIINWIIKIILSVNNKFLATGSRKQAMKRRRGRQDGKGAIRSFLYVAEVYFGWQQEGCT